MKIVQKYEECIGCGTCVALCPELWEMDDEGKARPKGGVKNPAGEYELEIQPEADPPLAEKKAECNKDAADSCPVQIIAVV